MSYCDRITDDGLIPALKQCKALETLTLHLCTELTDQIVHEIRHASSHLVTVDLSFCMNISVGPIRQIVYSLEDAVDRYLDAKKRRRYEEKSPGFFAGKARLQTDEDRLALRTLSITGCPLIPDPWEQNLEMALKAYHRVYDIL